MSLKNHQEIKNFWKDLKIFEFNKEKKSEEKIFSIDTPPPTISGHLHIGHIFSYTHTDFIARFKRMSGNEVFYPMGYDDNGLPTEKLIEKKFDKKASAYENKEEFKKNCENVIKESIFNFENLFEEIGISFDKNLTYRSSDKRSSQIALMSFFDLYQKKKIYFQNDTVFWDYFDQTAVSQAEIIEERIDSEIFHLKFFIEETFDEEDCENSDSIEIATTRPELLPEIRAIFVHPDELEIGGKFERFKGKFAISPLFFKKIPILPDERVVKDKGTGAVMCCFFGDELDVFWFKKYRSKFEEIQNKNDHNLKFSEIFELKNTLIERNGMINLSNIKNSFDEKFRSIHFEKLKEIFGFNQIFSEMNQKFKIKNFKKIILNLLGSTSENLEINQETEWEVSPKNSSSFLIKKEKFEKIIKKSERSGCEVEIIPAPQWYVKIKDEKEKWENLSEQINWIPSQMIQKIKSWISGLEYDWCVSRQRFWGIRFPVAFIKIFKDDESDFLEKKELILMFDHQNVFGAEKEKLFFNSFFDSALKTENESIFIAHEDFAPPYDIFDTDENLICQKGKILIKKNQKFFVRFDSNIMDTWFTSSLTPSINSYFHSFNSNLDSENILKILQSTSPNDLRPQAHEIIRTWAFYTIVKSYYHSNSIPWKNIMISGWCLSKEGEKMSKSKGNIVQPEKILAQFSPDAIRYWAANSNLGSDTRYDENILKNGRKLTLKIENVFKFLSQFKDQIKKFNSFDLNSLIFNQNFVSPHLELIDLEFLQRVNLLIVNSTKFFEEFNYFKALDLIENFFWKEFCDNFIEISKVRAYGQYDGVSEKMQKSALWTLCFSFFTLLRLFSPIIPFVSEAVFLEIKNEFYQQESEIKSIHSQNTWPKTIQSFSIDQNSKNLEIFEQILSFTRKFKTLQGFSQKEKIKNAKIFMINDQFFEKNINLLIFDLKNVCQFENFETHNFKSFIELKKIFENEINLNEINQIDELIFGLKEKNQISYEKILINNFGDGIIFLEK